MRDKDCYCHACNKEFNSLGISRHRAMHRDKKEDCKITYKNGETINHTFNKKQRRNKL